MHHLALMLIATLLVAGAIDTAPPYVVSAPSRPAAAVSTSAPCLPAAVTRGATVVALGAYTGRGPNQPFMLEGSNHPLRTIAVTGGGKDDVVLDVTAYEPILWDVSAIKGRLRAVVAAGYYPQAIKGLPAKIPVRFSSVDSPVDAAPTCGSIRFAYNDTLGVMNLAADVTRAIGVHPRRFYGRYSAESLPIDTLDASRAVPPDLSDVRASAPIVTRDDPRPGYEMRMMYSSDDRAGGSALKAIEWDASGAIIRDTGGRPAVDRGRYSGAASRSYGGSPSWSPAPRRTSSIWSILKAIWWTGWIGAILFALSQWIRSRRPERHDPPAVPAPALPAEAPPPADAVAIAARPALDARIADLTAIAAITDFEPLVVALHRYGREVQNLHRSSFDTDLADEINMILQRHFAHAIARYRQVRPSLDGVEAQRADETLTHAIERLVVRLQELHREQHSRDVAGVDEAARFIDARHPV